MTAEEKAIELVNKFYQEIADSSYFEDNSKQCALIAVDEVLGYMGSDRGTEFWQQVKIEIENL